MDSRGSCVSGGSKNRIEILAASIQDRGLIIAAIFNGPPLKVMVLLEEGNGAITYELQIQARCRAQSRSLRSHKPRYFTARRRLRVSHHPSGINRRQEDLSSTLILPILSTGRAFRYDISGD